MAVRATFMAAPGAMPTATLEFTAAPKTMAMAAQAMPTAMDRGESAIGRLMASLSTAILTPAAAITPTTTATGWAHTGAFRFAPKSECGGDVTAPRYARRGARRDMKTFWRMHAHRCSHLEPPFSALGALIGGGASLCAAIYTQRCQDRPSAHRRRGAAHLPRSLARQATGMSCYSVALEIMPGGADLIIRPPQHGH